MQRRGGEQGSPPSDFMTPRWECFCTNLLASLPVVLANDGQADTLLTLAVADDVNTAKDKIKEITLRILLSVTDARGCRKSTGRGSDQQSCDRPCSNGRRLGALSRAAAAACGW